MQFDEICEWQKIERFWLFSCRQSYYRSQIKTKEKSCAHRKKKILQNQFLWNVNLNCLSRIWIRHNKLIHCLPICQHPNSHLWRVCDRKCGKNLTAIQHKKTPFPASMKNCDRIYAKVWLYLIWRKKSHGSGDSSP